MSEKGASDQSECPETFPYDTLAVRRGALILLGSYGDPLPPAHHSLSHVRADGSLTLDAFIDEHDATLHGSAGTAVSTVNGSGGKSDLPRILSTASLRISNGFSDLEALYRHLDSIDLLNEERLRPGWDLYFMVSCSTRHCHLAVTFTRLS